MHKTVEWPYLCKPIITRVQQSAVSFFWENIWSQSLGEERMQMCRRQTALRSVQRSFPLLVSYSWTDRLILHVKLILENIKRLNTSECNPEKNLSCLDWARFVFPSSAGERWHTGFPYLFSSLTWTSNKHSWCQRQSSRSLFNQM